jgi:hypothetical protein
MRFLDDTVRRERHRERFGRWRFAGLLTCSLLACQWPYIHSNAADAPAARADLSSRVALFARPDLQYVVAEARPAELNLQRLAFVSAFALGQGQVAQLPVAVVAAASE